MYLHLRAGFTLGTVKVKRSRKIDSDFLDLFELEIKNLLLNLLRLHWLTLTYLKFKVKIESKLFSIYWLTGKGVYPILKLT